MAHTLAPSDIITYPSSKIVFNAPFDDKHTYHIKVTNSGGRSIGWALKTNNMKRLSVNTPNGVLDPKESVVVAISCDVFSFEKENTKNDRITIVWSNVPDGASKFSYEWFETDGITRRKNLSIEYNP